MKQTTVLKSVNLFVVLKFDEASDTDWVWYRSCRTQDEAYAEEQALRASGIQATTIHKKVLAKGGLLTQAKHVTANDWSKHHGVQAQVQAR